MHLKAWSLQVSYSESIRRLLRGKKMVNIIYNFFFFWKSERKAGWSRTRRQIFTFVNQSRWRRVYTLFHLCMYCYMSVSSSNIYAIWTLTSVKKKNKNQFSAQDGFVLSLSGYFFPSVLNFVWIHSVCNYCLCVENFFKKISEKE